MEQDKNTRKMQSMSYQKFALMMIISFFIMYFIMFLNIDSIAHYYTSVTRIYMAVLMIAPMAVLMLLMMGKMYPGKKTNISIIITSIIVFIVTLFALRTQTPIGDAQYMKAMIPHHSSAILVSKHANLKDPEVRKLAEEIIKAQVKEIKEMNALLKKLDN